MAGHEAQHCLLYLRTWHMLKDFTRPQYFDVSPLHIVLAAGAAMASLSSRRKSA